MSEYGTRLVDALLREKFQAEALSDSACALIEVLQVQAQNLSETEGESLNGDGFFNEAERERETPRLFFVVQAVAAVIALVLGIVVFGYQWDDEGAEHEADAAVTSSGAMLTVPDAAQVKSRQDILDLPADTLSVRATGLSDDDLGALKRMQSLVLLDLSGSEWWSQGRFSVQGMKHVAKLISLREVRLPDYCDNDMLAPIVRLPNLQRLDLSKTLVDDDGLECLRGKMSLRDFRAPIELRDAGLDAITSLKNLHSLSLKYCSGLSAEGIQGLAALNGLRELNLSHCAAVDDSSGALLALLPELERLSLAHTGVSGAVIRSLFNHDSLHDLDLSYCEKVDDKSLIGIQSLTHLKTLNLSGSKSISDISEWQLSVMKGLRVLVIGGTSITPESKGRLKRLLPQCEILDFLK